MRFRSSFVGALVLAAMMGCHSSYIRSPNGHYSSPQDMGVFIFRSDGVFGYKFAAKVDFYDEANLPPEKGHWKLASNDALEIQLDNPDIPKFRIDWHPDQDSFDVIRLERDGSLQMKARYNKKG